MTWREKMKHMNIELINLKCNMMNIPKISKVFKGMVESLVEISIATKGIYVLDIDGLQVIEDAIKDIVKDEFLSFELRFILN